MSRPARISINLNSLHHNLNRVRSLAPQSQVMAIIKANAYGHGIERVAKALPDADAFGVACLEEATVVRQTGVSKPIVLLEGPYSQEELNQIESLGIEIVVHQSAQINMLETSDIHGPVKVWLKIDTGMHRLGIHPDELDESLRRLKACDCVDNEIKLMTHLACANELDNPLTSTQLALFDQLTADAGMPKTIANSAAILSLSQTHHDWVRPGIMLYGISPFPGDSGADYDLKPVMTFESEIISIRQLQKGDSVGYGAAWKADKAMPVGIVAAGYGDGYPRHAPSGTPVRVNDCITGLVGHVSMDMLAIDLSPVPDTRIGDTVTLWGEKLPVEQVASSAGTIPYELVSSVQKRLHFIEHGQS